VCMLCFTEDMVASTFRFKGRQHDSCTCDFASAEQVAGVAVTHMLIQDQNQVVASNVLSNCIVAGKTSILT